MDGPVVHTMGPGGFAEAVAAAARVAVPVVVGLGVVAMLVSPEAFAETETVAGETPWGGAVAGLGAFLAFTALPLGLFAWALRAGRRRGLLLTAVAAPCLALFAGVFPLAGAVAGGWKGVSPLAVLLGAGCAVLHGFVLAAALRALRRRRPPGETRCPGAGRAARGVVRTEKGIPAGPAKPTPDVRGGCGPQRGHFGDSGDTELAESAGTHKTSQVEWPGDVQTAPMSRSIRSARTDHLVPPAPQYAATRAAAGRWLLLKWGVLVVLCLCFWAALAGLLVAIS